MKDFHLPKLKCVKCGHEWFPRREKAPKVCPICKRKNWSKLFLLIPFLIFLGCNKLTGKTSPMPNSSIPDIQTVDGVSNQDYPLVGGIRTENSVVSVRVLKNGIWESLNSYEFELVQDGVKFGHEVDVVGKSISYQVPFVPMAPLGTNYEIVSILNH